MFYGQLYKRLIEAEPDRIAGVVVLPGLLQRGFRGVLSDILYRVRFLGLRGTMWVALRLTSAWWRRSGAFVSAALSHGIPVIEAQTITEVGKKLAQAGASIVLATVPVRIPPQLLASVPGGWVNTHCGPLPQYAGVDAPFWCLHHGEPELAVTLHYMTSTFDSGPIIAQAAIPNDGRPYFHLVEELFDLALDMHKEFVRTLEPSPEQAQQQDAALRTYFGRPPVSAGRVYRRRGGRFA